MCCTPSFQGLRITVEEGQKDPELMDDNRENSDIWTHQSSCTCTLTMIVTVCTQNVQAQAKPNISMARGTGNGPNPSLGVIGN